MEGHNNTKYFHNFSSYWKNKNSIWDLNDEDGGEIHSFEDLARFGVTHFKNLFSELRRNCLTSTMRLIQKYPRMVSEEEEEDFLMDISNGELLVVR